jgi:hypothetical protein
MRQPQRHCLPRRALRTAGWLAPRKKISFGPRPGEAKPTYRRAGFGLTQSRGPAMVVPRSYRSRYRKSAAFALISLGPVRRRPAAAGPPVPQALLLSSRHIQPVIGRVAGRSRYIPGSITVDGAQSLSSPIAAAVTWTTEIGGQAVAPQLQACPGAASYPSSRSDTSPRPPIRDPPNARARGTSGDPNRLSLGGRTSSGILSVCSG